MEYQAFASIIQYRDESCEIVVVETTFLSLEAHLDQSTHAVSHDLVSVNLTQGTVPQAQDSVSSTISDSMP